jgi:thiol-disulfide isomerase/thioredoxin
MKNLRRVSGFVAGVSIILVSVVVTGSLFAQAAAKESAPSADDIRFEARAREMQEKAMKAMYAEFEKGVRELQKEFPNRPEVYEILLEIANKAEPEKAKGIAKEITSSTAAEAGVKEAAKGLLTKLEAVGKPVDIKFTAIDGREVDLSKMKEKVILIDFWATWCGPCIREIPAVKAAYEKLNAKGFEIVGISFDKEKDKLASFVAEKKMPWPQYYDGQGWANEFGKKFGINSIPAMWLVDKKGNLRDLEARTDLEEKIEKLLAEK